LGCGASFLVCGIRVCSILLLGKTRFALNRQVIVCLRQLIIKIALLLTLE